MKKLLLLLLLPTTVFADRFGSIKSNADVPLSTQTILNQSTLQTGATAYPDYIIANTSLKTPYIANSRSFSGLTTYPFLISSNNYVVSVSTLAFYHSGSGDTVMIEGYPNSVNNSLLSVNATDIGGNFTDLSSIGATVSGYATNTSIVAFNGDAVQYSGGAASEAYGALVQGISFGNSYGIKAIADGVAANYGVYGSAGAPGGAGPNYGLYGTASGAPGSTNNFGLYVANGQAQINSSMTVAGAGGESVTYQLSVGSMTGAGLSSCSSASSALTWNSGTELFGCNTITGGAGGASALAVYTGNSALARVQVSSPTQPINLDESTLSAALTGGSTAYISVQAGISTPSASFTIGSTSTVILANCLATCTMTLPTAVGIGGKRFAIQMQNAASIPLTIATTSGQTINGNGSYTVSVASTTVDLISDNANWQIE